MVLLNDTQKDLLDEIAYRHKVYSDAMDTLRVKHQQERDAVKRHEGLELALAVAHAAKPPYNVPKSRMAQAMGTTDRVSVHYMVEHGRMK